MLRRGLHPHLLLQRLRVHRRLTDRRAVGRVDAQRRRATAVGETTDRASNCDGWRRIGLAGHDDRRAGCQVERRGRQGSWGSEWHPAPACRLTVLDAGGHAAPAACRASRGVGGREWRAAGQQDGGDEREQKLHG